MSDAPHPRAPRLPWRHLLAAAVVALGLGGVTPLAPQGALATPQTGAVPGQDAGLSQDAVLGQDAQLEPTDLGDGVEGQLSADLVLHDGGALSPGEAVTATILLSNRTDQIASAGEISFHIDDETIDTRYDLTAWTENTQSFPDFSLGTEVYRQTVDQVHPGSTLEFTVTIPASATQFLAASSFGTRGLTLQWHADGGIAAQGRSSFVWDAESPANPVGISPVVPIVTDLGDEGLLDAVELEQLTAPEGDLTQLLDAVAGTSATLAIDPRLLVSIRALGADAPETAVAWLERLESLEDPSFALEFADASLTLQAQAGLEAPIETTGFRFETSQHEFFTEVQPTPTPTEPTGTETPGSTNGTDAPEVEGQADSTGELPLETSLTEPGETDPAQTNPSQTDPAQTGAGEPDADDAADEEEPILEPREAPEAEELLEFDYTRPDLSWPASGTVESLEALTDWGAETIILAGDQATSSPDRSATPSSQQQIAGTEVLVTDQTLDAAIASAVTAESTLEFQDASTDIASLLAVIAREAPNEVRQIVTVLPREALADPELLGELLAGLTDNSWTAIDAIPTRADDPSILPETELVPGGYAQETVTEFLELTSALERGMNLTALYEDPQAVDQELQVALLWTIRNSVIETDAWPGERAEFTEFATGVADEISIVGDSEIQLIGHESSLPLFIENASDRDVTVELRLRPTTGHLTVDEVTTVTIPAGTVTRATLPVQAIANGVSGVEATLWTTTNVQLNNSAEFVVNVNASLETVAVGILIGAGVLLFVLGIWRTIRRRTRDNAAEVEESSESESAPTESSNND
ncbi:DUF6049 family protein [Gulosibacter chungangensis]|uniref:Uncharacterized protein n=1 Tax=Gulosibacter chungangensis TaxID=979746 RepID=A0A7J5BFZ2_9MICO|nr:DUF6049 family protein [Gulosibacter chungangensis]KAB1645196.1 hypothetical protein F8O05_02780 [Gulosibacter chungangensis]